jgi:hypothetical protein
MAAQLVAEAGEPPILWPGAEAPRLTHLRRRHVACKSLLPKAFVSRGKRRAASPLACGAARSLATVPLGAPVIILRRD